MREAIAEPHAPRRCSPGPADHGGRGGRHQDRQAARGEEGRVPRPRGRQASFLPFFSIAAVEALKQYPSLNASIERGEATITYPAAENVGIAVDTEKGLIVPVVKNAGDLNIPVWRRRSRTWPSGPATARSRPTSCPARRSPSPTPVRGRAVRHADRPAAVGILGTGAIVKRPVVINDPELGEVIAIRSVCTCADLRPPPGRRRRRGPLPDAVKQRLEEGNFDV